MLSPEDIKGLVAKLTYKPGTRFTTDWPARTLFIFSDRLDSRGSGKTVVLSHAADIGAIYDVDYFKWWIRVQCQVLECHELDEWLLLDGERIEDPHVNGQETALTIKFTEDTQVSRFPVATVTKALPPAEGGSPGNGAHNDCDPVPSPARTGRRPLFRRRSVV